MGVESLRQEAWNEPLKREKSIDLNDGKGEFDNSIDIVIENIEPLRQEAMALRERIKDKERESFEITSAIRKIEGSEKYRIY